MPVLWSVVLPYPYFPQLSFLSRDGFHSHGQKGSSQGSYFEAISGVFPYPNGSCKKIGFHIELQIYAIGMGWLLLALPP